MNSSQFFKHHADLSWMGQSGPMRWLRKLRRAPGRDQLKALAGVGAVLLVFVLMGYLDERSEKELQVALEERQLELDIAFEKGRAKGHADMLTTAQAGWGMALHEANQAIACRQQRRLP